MKVCWGRLGTRTFGLVIAGLAGFASISRISNGVQIIAENDNAVCEEYRISRQLRVFKDPAIFLSNINQVYLDPSSAWETLAYENPLLTTVKGALHMVRLGPPRGFRNFGSIARVYDIARLGTTDYEKSRFPIDNNTQILPVKICGQNEAYSDSLGFVVVPELVWAQSEDDDGQLPPSTAGNPIPRLKMIPDVALKDVKSGG